MTNDKMVMERLGFIQYLYTTAAEQANKPQPMASASVLTFHDAVELYAKLSAEYLDVTISKHAALMEYWNEIDNSLPSDITFSGKGPMSRLDESRANLKHHGIRPDESVIEEHRVSVKNFFEENTPVVFDTDFSNISLVNLVNRDETREGIEEAVKYLEKSDLARSLGALAMTYKDLIEYYRTTSRQNGYGMFSRSPYFAPKVGRRDHGEIGSAIEELHEQMTDSIENLEEAITILSLNVDYNDFSKFTNTIPEIVYDIEKNSSDRNKRPYLEGLKTQQISQRDVRWCVDFLVELAINLQETGA